MTAAPAAHVSHKTPRKRARPNAASVGLSYKALSQHPRLFAPFRALGLVTNHVPSVLQARSFKGSSEGPRIHVLTCLGRSWALWEGGKMGLLFVGPDASQPISSLAMDGDAVWAAAGPEIMKYLRGKEVLRLSNPLGAAVSSILVFGTQLLALTEDGSRLFVWDTVAGEVQAVIQFESDFTATQMLHPATYLNKIIVGSSQGTMQLWNIRSQTCIHTFSSACLRTVPIQTDTRAPSPPCAITALTQSPAIDVVGIGFSSGEVSVYDVRTDERLMRMFMEGGIVTALGFRSDGHPVLASASSSGHIALWDLNAGGRLLHVMRGAHDSAVNTVEWIPNQPVLVSSGEDNSVKQWLFDSPTAPPRLLKFRSGHHQPPHLIRYHGDDGKQLLTASRDRSLRCTSVVRDSRSFELSQGSLAKKATSLSIPLASLKFAPILAISHSSTRAKDWDDVLTAHADETFARSWTVLGKRLGKQTFGFADDAKGRGKVGSVKAVCVTACGNFGLAGSSTGAISMWNMQSGLKRKDFDVGSSPPDVIAVGRARAVGKKRGEGRCITGLATDPLNRVVIASTLDGTINFFDFHSTKLGKVVVLPSNAVSIILHRDNGLLAVICDDDIVRLIDIETYKVVRELGGFRGRVLDLTFSPDSRWLITTSLDSVIRTFDLPTGRLIDAFRTPSVATSVSFSPTNDFLATAHVDSVGVYLWANRAQFTEISFQSVSDDDIANVALPSTQGVAEDEALEALQSLTIGDEPSDIFLTPPQLEGDLVTLTLLPRSRWQTLLNLEVIQQRNKPKEPPKEPEKAPFFLPTLPGVEHRFAVDQKSTESLKSSRRLEKMAAQSESKFVKHLETEDPEGDYENLFHYAKTLSPAAIDLELRTLVSLDHLRLILHALTRRLRTRRDFEAVQTFQHVVLQMHGDIIVANGELCEALQALKVAQEEESGRVLELIASNLGILSFVRDAS